MIRRILILCLMICSILLSACGKMDKTAKNSQSGQTPEVPAKNSQSEQTPEVPAKNSQSGRTPEVPAKTNEPPECNAAGVSGVLKRDDGLYFANSLENFIDCYNANYCNDNGINYIRPYSEWRSYVQDFGRYKGDMHYEFTADRKIWTLPTITVYTPQNETIIKELTVNFDDHSYTEKMYKKYEEMCFYTLKVFFTDMDEKELTKLYKKLNKKAYDNIFQSNQGFHSDNPPSDLYYRDGTGVYPYFAYGESVRMCIIPVTKKVIKSYKDKGVKIHRF